MTAGFIALGILSISYYVFLAWYTRRWNSTFSWFWIAFGMFNIGTGLLIRDIPQWGEVILSGFMIMAWGIFLCIEIIILSAMVSIVPKNLDYVIILGAQIRGKRVTEALRRRLDRGVRYLRENPGTIVIVSGGQGKGEETSEAAAMAAYLQGCGIEEQRIYQENRSGTTYENLRNSLMLVGDEKRDKVGIITNNFHIYRAMKLAGMIGYKKRYALAASCNMMVFPNYMVREFFAVLVLFLRLQRSKVKE